MFNVKMTRDLWLRWLIYDIKKMKLILKEKIVIKPILYAHWHIALSRVQNIASVSLFLSINFLVIKFISSFFKNCTNGSIHLKTIVEILLKKKVLND